jgi:hypothetical protein
MGVGYWWLVLIWAVIVAVWSAYDDYTQIEDGEVIDHPTQWVIRAMVVGFPAYAVQGLLLAVALAFVFSAVFRLALNLMRGYHPLYIAPWSSTYDKVWTAVATLSWPSGAETNNMREWYFRVSRKHIHHVGLVAYHGELSLAATIIIYLCQR